LGCRMFIYGRFAHQMAIFGFAGSVLQLAAVR
jgi:hypothetical protein